MSPYRRNVLVGVTVLSALVILGWMILQFGGQLGTAFAGEQYAVTFVGPRADGVSPGSQVLYRGTVVGKVERVKLEAAQQRVVVGARLEKDAALPGGLFGSIKQLSLLGTGAAIELAPQNPALAMGGATAEGDTLDLRYGGLALLPPELSELSENLNVAVKAYNDSGLIARLRALADNTDRQVTQAGEVIEGFRAVFGDAAVQGDLRATVANLRATSERFEKFSADLPALSAQARGALANADARFATLASSLDERLVQVSVALDSANSVLRKIDSGDGSLGRLLNDGRLYEALLSSARRVDATLKDAQRVVQQIEQEGVSLRLR